MSAPEKPGLARLIAMLPRFASTIHETIVEYGKVEDPRFLVVIFTDGGRGLYVGNGTLMHLAAHARALFAAWDDPARRPVLAPEDCVMARGGGVLLDCICEFLDQQIAIEYGTRLGFAFYCFPTGEQRAYASNCERALARAETERMLATWEAAGEAIPVRVH